MPTTPSGIVYDRAGPRESPAGAPLLLLHAGIADRRMWDPVWTPLTAGRDVVRLDLRGFGDSDTRPAGVLDPVADVVAVLDAEAMAAADVVGASFGAGVAVELALTHPGRVSSLLLAAPGGSLLADRTPDLAAFALSESEALAAGDLDLAAQANVVWWVVGPDREPDAVDADVRAAVHAMQRRAFEIDAAWSSAGRELEPVELEPPALARLGEIAVPTTVLVGRFDLDTVTLAAAAVRFGVPGARLVRWDDVAHLPSMEQPDRFVDLVLRTDRSPAG